MLLLMKIKGNNATKLLHGIPENSLHLFSFTRKAIMYISHDIHSHEIKIHVLL